jgi:hypothetical protein
MTCSKIAILGALGAVCTAVGVGMGGCTVTSTTTNNVGDSGISNGGDSGNEGTDSSTNPDTSTIPDTGTGDAACPAVGASALFSPAECDTCTRANCCASETTCHSDTLCWTLETCFANCKSGDAGGPPDDAGYTPCDYSCFSTDDGGTAASTEQHDLDTCQVTNCKTECGL